MHYDFWNNPLVVTAMRLKYRRGSPGFTTSLYALVLLSIGALLYHYQANISMPVGLIFLLIILGLQIVVSGGIALFSVANSMNAEVLNRTMDFQRIVSLSPREIIWGKMIGEPMLAYFLTIGSLPFAVLCWSLGSTSLLAIALFYVNIVTTILLCSAIGSIHTLIPATTAIGRGRNPSGGITALAWIPFVFLPGFLASGTGWQDEHLLGLVVNLLTPLGSLQFLYEGDPWGAKVYLWHWSIPSLVMAPVTHLFLVHLIVTAMSRRLKNTLEPSVKRGQTYFLLMLVDLLLASAMFKQWQGGSSADRLAMYFGFAHLVISLVLLMGITPGKAVLMSWVWRFQSRENWLRSSLAGSRAEITAVLPVYCLIGALVAFLGFAVPTHYNTRVGNVVPVDMGAFVETILVTSVLLISLGLIYQVCLACFQKGGKVTFVVLLLLVSILPIIITSILIYPKRVEEATGLAEAMLSLSPASYYFVVMRNSSELTITPVWLVLFYAGLGLAGFVWLRRWLKYQHEGVEVKLRKMGVLSK